MVVRRLVRQLNAEKSKYTLMKQHQNVGENYDRKRQISSKNGKIFGNGNCNWTALLSVGVNWLWAAMLALV